MSIYEKIHAYYVQHNTVPLTCCFCGKLPSEDKPVIERNHGEPKLLCFDCAYDAQLAVFDLDVRASGYDTGFRP